MQFHHRLPRKLKDGFAPTKKHLAGKSSTALNPAWTLWSTSDNQTTRQWPPKNGCHPHIVRSVQEQERIDGEKWFECTRRRKKRMQQATYSQCLSQQSENYEQVIQNNKIRILRLITKCYINCMLFELTCFIHVSLSNPPKPVSQTDRQKVKNFNY